MKDDQFEVLLKAINEIKDSVESLKGANSSGRHGGTLADICGEVSSVESSVSSVQTAVEELKGSIEKLSR